MPTLRRRRRRRRIQIFDAVSRRRFRISRRGRGRDGGRRVGGAPIARRAGPGLGRRRTAFAAVMLVMMVILDGAGQGAGRSLHRFVVMRLLMRLRRVGVERPAGGRRGRRRRRSRRRVFRTAAAAGHDAGRRQVSASGATGVSCSKGKRVKREFDNPHRCLSL